VADGENSARVTVPAVSLTPSKLSGVLMPLNTAETQSKRRRSHIPAARGDVGSSSLDLTTLVGAIRRAWLLSGDTWPSSVYVNRLISSSSAGWPLGTA
jgi:hypothetical protein